MYETMTSFSFFYLDTSIHPQPILYFVICVETTMTIHDPQIGIQLTYTIPNVEEDLSTTTTTTTSDANSTTNIMNSSIGSSTNTIAHQKTFLASQFPPARMGLPENVQPKKVNYRCS
jgi:hypothetical protein